ncbi:GDP-mannose-dependent alpha-mannosyltransferase [Agromyces sp. NDB4Y10]|uniref:glycosyltransferase n=1 Tax=Agromyces sp. NDB4Y10 TaxID=1775951 RepID=UPI0007B2CE7C|nr:glycosyltransferase [Agromyces sp. NDB4Y10]KZE94495.1 GDP-mannose-dependent alpha-mannosyltransferase [Agromyces sp. NDB4Y10]
MRVALLAESFLPHMNGVTHSLLQVLRHLERRGHEALVIAPRSGPVDHGLHGARAEFLRSAPLPGYPEVRVALTGVRRLTGVLGDFRPDVVHLASPFVLGWQGVLAAERLAVPSVAVYQTDVPAYAERYGMAGAEPVLARHVARIHRRATLTLAPSSAAATRLEGYGVERMRRWARGVDTERFHPVRRDPAWRRRFAADDEVLVGYVGRLAPEKQVEDLRALTGIEGVRLVVVGDGPSRVALEAALPGARFTGFLGGEQLATAVASLDLFVHPGESETFCQTVQEALASGVPVVATGRGGPLDLVHSSRDGWLYRPGDLGELAARVRDLAGDDAKRRAFGRAAREGVAERSWERLGDELLAHYELAARIRSGVVASPAVTGHAITARRDAEPAPAATVRPTPPAPAAARRWERFVAVGDSVTEGLCDSSRMAAGEYRGWADRLAMLLAATGGGVGYANLAVRSRRVRDVVDVQLPHAMRLRADLVTVLAGGNDLVRIDARPEALADRLADAVLAVRAAGCDVLVVTPFVPAHERLGPVRARFARFGERMRHRLEGTDVLVLDAAAHDGLTARGVWAEDRVHLNSSGHRALAYAAASVLGVPDAAALAALDAALHGDADEPDAPPLPTGEWLRRHAVPWAGRRLLGRTAGDGRSPKHADLVHIPPPDRAARRARTTA